MEQTQTKMKQFKKEYIPNFMFGIVQDDEKICDNRIDYFRNKLHLQKYKLYQTNIEEDMDKPINILKINPLEKSLNYDCKRVHKINQDRFPEIIDKSKPTLEQITINSLRKIHNSLEHLHFTDFVAIYEEKSSSELYLLQYINLD